MTEVLVSAPSKLVTFAAKREDLRLVRRARYPRYEGGLPAGETVGQCIAFVNGRLDVPLEGTVTLEDGRTAPAEEILEWLMNHRLMGDIFEGFFKVEMAAPPPTQEEMQAMVDAAMALDVDKLEEIVRQEEEGWQREAILGVAREGVQRIHAFKAQAAEQAAAEAAQASAEPEPTPKPKAGGK